MKRNGRPSKVRILSRKEGKKLLDQEARRSLNMSGDEFVRRWKAKKFDNPDRPEVMRVAFLLPLAG
ncbi:MAG: hypothetical protein U1E51_28045 [Candidatus Binatia bacterium]|nr:hypothetical protein [Candidatus Binatia bacterium]